MIGFEAPLLKRSFPSSPTEPLESPGEFTISAKPSSGSRDPHAVRRVRTRGAVLAEFAIVIVPLMSTFFGFWQVGKGYLANILLLHAANAGARIAAVELPPNPGDNGDPEVDIPAAVHLALGRWDGAFSSVAITHTTEASESDPYGMVTVRLVGTFSCNVPLGSLLMCGRDRKLQITQQAVYPNQGAVYK